MTPDQIRNLIAEKTTIDGERVRVEQKDSHVEIGVVGCTEGLQRGIENGLRREGLEGGTYRVVRDEHPDFAPAYDLEKLRTMIIGLHDAPDGQLDKMFAARCRHFSPDSSLDETLKFIRNLRDECVFCAGASDFVMRLFGYMLEDYPESDEVKTERRADLEIKYGL